MKGFSTSESLRFVLSGTQLSEAQAVRIYQADVDTQHFLLGAVSRLDIQEKTYTAHSRRVSDGG